MTAPSNRHRSISALAGVLCAVALGAAGAAPAQAADTVVSLTFKDTLISQYDARQILADHNMNGTFFVNSGLVLNRAADVSGRMSWRQINELATDGNEIGGGGQTRTNLVGLTDAQLEAEICDDRDELARRGYAPASFGYPFGVDHNATVEAKVQQCGYESARSVGGIGSGAEPKAESIPPANPFATRTRGQVDDADSLADMQSWVTEAEGAGGGWVQLVIHSVCASGCSITPGNLDALLDWLQPRAVSGTHVRTVREVMTGTAQPQPQPFLPATISLNFDDGLNDHYDIARPVLAANGLPGTFYVNSGNVGEDTNRWMNWTEVRNLADQGFEVAGHATDHDDLVGLDEDELEEQICDDRSRLTNMANLSASQVPVSFAYPRGVHDQAVKDMVEQCGYISGRWTEGLKWYTRTSRCQFLSCPFAEDIHPPDPYRIRIPGSFGQVDLNDIEKYKQTVRNLQDSGGGWMPLLFHEICQGPNPQTSGCPDESSSTTPERFTEFMEWIADQEETNGLRVRTMEEVMTGPPEPREPVDTTDPVSQIQCDGGACSPAISEDPISVTLSATDSGGSGLKEIRYTADGSVPTGSSPVYGGPIEVGDTTTIRWRASDNHGNVEQLRSRLVQVDQGPPVSSIACDSAACGAGFFNHAVSVTLSATAGPSGLMEIRYTTDGSAPNAGSTLYGGPFIVSSNTTIRFRGEDNDGHVESPAKSQTIQIETQAPTSSIECDGGACQGGVYDHAVSATLSAADSGGSGVKEIRYTTDGSAPSASSNPYTGAIPVGSTTTIRFRAEDNAGNLEAPQSRTVQIQLPAAGQGDNGQGVAGTNKGRKCKPKKKPARSAKRKRKCKKPKPKPRAFFASW